jgi:hypothetical protein
MPKIERVRRQISTEIVVIVQDTVVFPGAPIETTRIYE